MDCCARSNSSLLFSIRWFINHGCWTVQSTIKVCFRYTTFSNVHIALIAAFPCSVNVYLLQGEVQQLLLEIVKYLPEIAFRIRAVIDQENMHHFFVGKIKK